MTSAYLESDSAGASTVPENDCYVWLEDIDSEKSLDWVAERNAHTAIAVAKDGEFAGLRNEIRDVLNSTEKIPHVVVRGDYLYNFWTDSQHPRGLWRRTTLEQFRSPTPRWETLLDVDALNVDENEDWVWHGAAVRRPDYDRALVCLSHGGSDADVTREFDLATRAWVTDGFNRPESKGTMSWVDADTVFISADFGAGSMTDSGYPRTIRRWKRGTSMDTAELIFQGAPNDLSVSARHDPTPGFERDIVVQSLTFYASKRYLLTGSTLTVLEVPDSAEVGLKREWMLVELRETWRVEEREFPQGALIAIRLLDFLAGSVDFTIVYEPDAHSALAGTTWTQNYLVLNVLNDVHSELRVVLPPETALADSRESDTWTDIPIDMGTTFSTISVAPFDADTSDSLWVRVTDFLTPTTLSLVPIGGTAEVLKTMPTFFDASNMEIEQGFATSLDGTQIPYFLVRPKDLSFDGTAPTLLCGYGGFEISLTPAYSGVLGRSWLARGGTYVLANIRGGGEYGPAWHQSAIRENRHRAYEDFAAVARDLVERGVTSARHLGAQGGSNGGLLTGNMLVSYPELFGALVVQVPLLDMKRYSTLLAGASWVAEYGDPEDPEDWAFLKTFSPYHLVDAKTLYPPVLFTTSTRDDRVHPGHARKMAALLVGQGRDVLYYENIEGGHGGAADNSQAAHMSALAYSFLWEKLTA